MSSQEDSATVANEDGEMLSNPSKKRNQSYDIVSDRSVFSKIVDTQP